MFAVLRSFAGIKISSSDFSGKVSDYRFLYGGEVSYRYIAASQEESLFFYGPTEDAMEIFVNCLQFFAAPSHCSVVGCGVPVTFG